MWKYTLLASICLKLNITSQAIKIFSKLLYLFPLQYLYDTGDLKLSTRVKHSATLVAGLLFTQKYPQTSMCHVRCLWENQGLGLIMLFAVALLIAMLNM